MMQYNRARKEAWNTISKEIFERFQVRMNPYQVKNHFSNRKKRVLREDRDGIRDRIRASGDVPQSKECKTARRDLSDEDMKIYNYFTTMVAHKETKENSILPSPQNELFAEEREIFGLEEDSVQMKKEVFGYFSENEGKIPHSHDVSASQLRILEAELMKYQAKCFDTWSRQATMQIEMIRKVLDLIAKAMKVIEDLQCYSSRGVRYTDRRRRIRDWCQQSLKLVAEIFNMALGGPPRMDTIVR
ncbi:unnamed protein product [Strongylus vulgaris]|uniref:Uncharacterized protein n=1 Tax=Strongylus vulgaris TaxID=40348 RepID=A0A3P7ICE9_STRVU|nr:unnamed protein product [Strongylus vulgaris]